MSAAEQLVIEDVVKKQPQTISEIISRMLEIRTERRKISAREKVLVEENDQLEELMKAKMKEQGDDIVTVSSKLATATKEETEVPAVDDWDAFWEYVFENKASHMLQRRVATNAWRELHEAGEATPGVRAVTKVTIGLTAK